MAKTILGLDIGASAIKMALMSAGQITKFEIEALPDNLVRDGRILSAEALAQFLEETLKKHNLHVKKCAVVLPPETALARRVSVPYMTVDQLMVNLPYEFHDYIQQEKDQFFYDYAVVDEVFDDEGEGKKLDLLAAAVKKSIIYDYRVMLGKAGLKLVTALPDCFTYRNLIISHEKNVPDHPSEYGIVDLGHSAIRLHIYRGSVYETTRIIEFGGISLDALIADHLDVDQHVAAGYKIANFENVQKLEAAMDLYGKIAIELMRAVNFYGFNNPDSDLQDLYFCGGLAEIQALMEVIHETLEITIHSITELMPDTEGLEHAAFGPAAVGVALQ